MSSLRFSKRQGLGFTCPTGGQWYSCSTGARFVGCCRTDPCSSDCTGNNLMPASFSLDSYGKFSDLTCPGGSLFYTCTGTKPAPFMGCCKTNPCEAGSICSGANLTAAHLPNDEDFSSSSVSSISSSTSTSSSSPSAASTGTTSNNTTLIVGVAVGGAIFLIALGLLLFWCLRRTKSSDSVSAPTYQDSKPTGPNTEQEHQNAAETTKFIATSKPYPTIPNSPAPEYSYNPDEMTAARDQKQARQSNYSMYSNGYSSVPSHSPSPIASPSRQYIPYNPHWSNATHLTHGSTRASSLGLGLDDIHISPRHDQTPLEMPAEPVAVYEMEGNHPVSAQINRTMS